MVVLLMLAALVACLMLSAATLAQTQPTITLTPAAGTAGATVVVHGTGFAPGGEVSIEAVPPFLQPAPHPPETRNGGTRPLAKAIAGPDGAFTVSVVLELPGTLPPDVTGYYEVLAYPASFGDRTTATILAAPIAFFRVLRSPQLPISGTGGLLARIAVQRSGWRSAPAMAVVGLLTLVFLAAGIVPMRARRR